MKIALIGQKGIPAKVGGVERHVEELAVRLARNGHEVFAYTRNNYTDKGLKNLKGVKLIHLPSISTKHLDAISHTFLATFHALFKNYDVIHFHAIGPTSLSFLVKIFKRKTVLVSTYHCQDYFHQKWGFFAKLYLKFGEYLTCKIPDKTITVSDTLKKFIKGKFKKEAVMIPNGMSVSWNSNESELKKWGLEKNGYILSVSRLIKHKGIHYLIEAFKKLEDKNLSGNKKLVIVGDGFYTDDYVAHLRKLAEGRENIIFTGSQTGETLSQLFSHAYSFVQPSESEGLSIALLEAMGYGRAILASDIPENAEVIEGVGFSFRSGSTEDLEEKLADLLGNFEKISEAGEKARQKAEKKYSWDGIANRIENLYKKLIDYKNGKTYDGKNIKI